MLNHKQNQNNMLTRLFQFSTAGALSLFILSSNAFAADIKAGKEKAQSCAACHGPEGVSAVPIYPNLAGQKQAYLEKQMKDFRDGKRPDPIMGPMAKPLSDEDIANISAYYASLK